MTYLKKYGLRLLYTIISIVVSLALVSTLYYFNIISINTYKILKIIVLLINIFISSLILGRKAKNKGYLEGIKFAAIIIVLFLLTTLLTNNSMELKVIIYYLIILFTSTLGSMVGISKKKN